MPETEQKSENVKAEAAHVPGAADSPELPPFTRTRDHADQDFGEAFIHSGPSRTGLSNHRVLGMRLFPFSFWHSALLDYMESPFAGYAGKIDIASLYAAVRICQMLYPNRPSRRRFEYLRELYLARKYNDARKIVVERGKIAFEISPFLRELNKFSLYIRDYHARPVYVPVRDGKPVHVPWYFYEVCLLRRWAGQRDSDKLDATSRCWDTPVGQGSWENIGMLEAHGNEAPIMTAAERIASKKTRQVRKPSAKLLARIAEVESMGTRVRYRV